MLSLGIKQFTRNMRRNIIVIVQLVLVYVIAIFTVSSCVAQLSLWHGVSDHLDKTGVVLWQNTYTSNTTLKDDLIKVEKTSTRYHYEITEPGVAYYVFTAMSPEYNYYKVPLIKGQWCEDGSAENGVVRVVVSTDFLPKCNVGDKITIQGLTLKIMGIYNSNELVYKDSAHGSEISYLDFYSKESEGVGLTNINNYYIMASYEDLFRECRPYPMQSIIVDYEDNITEEEIQANEEILREKYDYITGLNTTNTDEIYEYSLQLLQIKLVPMILIFAAALIFAIISVMTSGVVTVYAEQRNYGIYFACGNSWSRTIQLSVIHWTITAVTSLLCTLLVCLIINNAGLTNQFAINFSQYHLLVLLGITLLILLMSVILPFRILKKMQPINILKNNM